jgi:hypothetical protein
MTEDERAELVAIARLKACDLHKAFNDLIAVARSGGNEFRAVKIERHRDSIDTDLDALIAWLERGDKDGRFLS